MSQYRKTISVPMKVGSRGHRHANQDTLDSLRTNSKGELLVNNNPVVDKALLTQSLTQRDLLLRPYVVLSYSSYLAVSSGLPLLEMITFDNSDQIDHSATHNCTIKQYDAVMHTQQGNAQIATNSIPVSSSYQADGKARELWLTTIPSYDNLLIQVSFDSSSTWQTIKSDTTVQVADGFTSLRARLSLPVSTNPENAERPIFGLYLLYQ
ncbi:hypothetical protein CWB96_00430 [Pseudoalteromonas citrea]|uniref:Uncharacterized protein n=1 Tax=Pseudoalteromonas citrea TaxID=43655 RepID=A0A5S3XVD2_9GAMM|nr:hypothetical protein [Pseudoalteromonas citrea]TMP46333.1 hypothetical protein CWB97_02425 [Pseudoalteromonas citrea]TMP63109.1 hypothetical protein CWB96_00430 [Pseudoalteromonas citrea]